MEEAAEFIVAPLSEAPVLARPLPFNVPWPRVEVSGFGLSDLALMDCLVRGLRPRDPVQPTEWMTHPFSGRQVSVTHWDRSQRAFEAVAGDEQRSVFRVPAGFVPALASLEAEGRRALAAAWHEEKREERRRTGLIMRLLSPRPSEAEALATVERIAGIARIASAGANALMVSIAL